MTFIYFQFYLQKLKNLKSEHEKYHGKIDENRIYPWIVNFLDYPQHGFVGFLQKFVVKFALWWSLPSVLIIFALYYVKKHDLWISYYLGLLPLIATVLVVLFRINYEKEKFRTFIKENKFGFTMVAFLLIAEILFMACVIPWSMQGGKYDFLKPWICVDLSYQVLINEPETDYEAIYWADFNGVHLEGANLASAVLKRADLSLAHLKEARLVDANLQGANLYEADLQGAILWNTDLQGAGLLSANLQGATLLLVDLKGADLRGAENLTIIQLSVVKTLYETQLDSVLLEQVKAQYPHLLEPPE